MSRRRPHRVRPAKKARKALAIVGVCAECGCTDHAACVVDGVACHWLDEKHSICSACVPEGHIYLGEHGRMFVELLVTAVIEDQDPKALSLLSGIDPEEDWPRLCAEVFVGAMSEAPLALPERSAA